MVRRTVWRLIAMFSVLLVVSFLIFALGSLVRGSLASVIVGSEGATKGQYDQIARSLGLNQPFIIQYWHWLSGAVTGDLGKSPISGVSVAVSLSHQVPVSFELALLGMLLSIVIGVPAGLVASTRANAHSDVAIRFALLLAFSVPVFIVGVLLLFVVIHMIPHAFLLSYSPMSDGLVANLRSVALPVLTVAASQSAAMMQMTRSAMLDELFKPYVTTARSVGVRYRRLYGVHVLRNAVSPILTYAGFQFGVLLGSVVVVEQIFNLPGLGRGLLEAISTRDYPMVTGISMVFAVTFVCVNILVDVLQPLADPRQRKV